MDASHFIRTPAVETCTFVQHVRKRPGMYIGDPDEQGLETCILELLSGPVAAHLQDRCSRIDVHLHRDGSLSIRDDRRGWPSKPKGLSDLGFLERELTQPNRERTLPISASRIELSLARLGPWCVAAVSERFVVRWNHRGTANEIRIARGVVKQRRCRPLRPASASAPGCLIRFKPDPQIFGNARLDFARLAWRLRELAFLSPGLCLILSTRRPTDGDAARSVRFVYPKGIADYVRELAIPTARLHPEPLVVKGQSHGISIAAAVVYQDSDDYRLLSYVNYRPTKWGSTHLEGLVDGLAEAINLACEEEPSQYSGHFVRHGINCILDVRMLQPRYFGATKERLCNTEAYDAVRSVCRAGFRKLLKAHPQWHSAILRHLGGLQFADREMREDKRVGAAD